MLHSDVKFVAALRISLDISLDILSLDVFTMKCTVVESLSELVEIPKAMLL